MNAARPYRDVMRNVHNMTFAYKNLLYIDAVRCLVILPRFYLHNNLRTRISMEILTCDSEPETLKLFRKGVALIPAMLVEGSYTLGFTQRKYFQSCTCLFFL